MTAAITLPDVHAAHHVEGGYLIHPALPDGHYLAVPVATVKLLQPMRQGTTQHLSCLSGLSPHAYCACVAHDNRLPQVIVLIIEEPTAKCVKEGGIIPAFVPVVRDIGLEQEVGAALVARGKRKGEEWFPEKLHVTNDLIEDATYTVEQEAGAAIMKRALTEVSS